MMGRICYEAIINCYNQEHEAQGSDKARPDLIPNNDKIHLLDEACKSVLTDDDIGFLEKVFGVQTRLSYALFKQTLMTPAAKLFLQPHAIRMLVYQDLKELLLEAGDDY